MASATWVVDEVQTVVCVKKQATLRARSTLCIFKAIETWLQY